MKKIEAVIRDEKLTEVREALEASGFYGMTVQTVKGRGAQGGILLQWRVGEYRVDLIPKKLLMLVVKEADCQRAVEIICEINNCGNAGDGKIFISTVDEVIRIRTRETGETAL